MIIEARGGRLINLALAHCVDIGQRPDEFGYCSCVAHFGDNSLRFEVRYEYLETAWRPIIPAQPGAKAIGIVPINKDNPEIILTYYDIIGWRLMLDGGAEPVYIEEPSGNELVALISSDGRRIYLPEDRSFDSVEKFIDYANENN